MSSRINYTLCPVCSSASIHKVLSAIDHTVSQEEFEIWECSECSLRFTQHVPDMSSIGDYYKSEDYISHSDTAKGLVNRIYRIVRKKSLRGKRRLVEKQTRIRKGNLLDVGSGTGHFANEMKRSGWNVTALEPDEGARQFAKKEHDLDLVPIDELFKLKHKTFDAITLWHVLEHVHDLPTYVAQLRELLKDNGKLFIAVPNYTSFDAEVYGPSWAAYDVPRHLYHFSPASMSKLMSLFSLKIIKQQPMWYDSFYVSLLSSRYKTGKTNWPEAVWTGLLSNIKAMDKKQGASSIIYIVSR